jgi:hypothetical protein
MYWVERVHVLYYKLPDLHRLGIAGKVVDKLLARIVKLLLNRLLPAYFKNTADRFMLTPRKEGIPVICSITTFPARINSVWIPIECIFRQTIRPDRVILWLSQEQFPDRKLPQSLMDLVKRGLEIEFCDGDLKAHKKYLYALEKFPEAYVITFDDDLFYDSNAIDNLMALKQKYPNAIVTNRAHRITFTPDGKICPYRKWQHNVACIQPSHALVATGGCGTLYEKRLLHADVTNTEHIKALSFFADDLWLKVMALMNHTMVVTNRRYGKDPIIVGKTQTEKLVATNVLQGGNDEQLRKTMAHYNLHVADFKD